MRRTQPKKSKMNSIGFQAIFVYAKNVRMSDLGFLFEEIVVNFDIY